MSEIPKAPKFSLGLIGPGIVLVAMGLGSGEYILWPYLVADFGFGIIWGAIIGITAQYFVSNEAGRYTLITGGSIYTAFNKINKRLPIWFIISTFAAFAWPGIIAASGEIFAYIFRMPDSRIPTVVMLLVIGLLLTFTGKVYRTLEVFQKIVIGISIPVLIVIFLLLNNIEMDIEFFKGIVGIGEGYLFLPRSISLLAFLGAVAYSGAGGNLVLPHSFYIQDKGLGMAQTLDTQIDNKKSKKGLILGKEVTESEENIRNFKDWFNLVAKEQFISFWFIGLLAIFLLVLIAYALAYPFEGKDGLDFVSLQSTVLSNRFGSIVGIFFLLTGITFLFTTQLGIFETTSRIMSENIQLLSEKVRLRFSREKLFFFFLWAQILVSIFIIFFISNQPVQILLIQTFFSAVSMLVLSIYVQIVNNSNLIPSKMKPGFFRNIVLGIAVIFFGVFVVLTLFDLFIGI